jgi:TPR repeat protein
MYEQGEGIEQNKLEAYQWYLLAADNGNQDAIQALGQSLTSLSPEQIQQGRQWVKEWQAKKNWKK